MSNDPTPAPGTILVSLAVNDRGEFWKKTEFALLFGATEADIDAALAQGDLMHARLVDRMYAPAPVPTGGDPAPGPEASAVEAVPAKAATPAPARAVPAADLATDKQVKAIYAIGRNARHMSAAAVDAHCAEQYQGRQPDQLSKREASQLIDSLKAGQAA